MESLDLNINNYDYDDLLKLFKLNFNFDFNDLKKAKKQVLMMHPDKSGLDKKYFLFFSSAFKLLHSVYEFREKANVNLNEDIEYEYTTEKNNEELELVNKLGEKYKNPKDFNIFFNKEFEKLKVESEYDKTGYGEWLKKEDNVEICKNQNEMNEMINKKKHNLRNLIKYEDIKEFNENGYSDLTNSKPDEYGSSIFSKLQFEDLKKAHNESVVPVVEEDIKNNYKSLEDLKFKRNNQNLEPHSDIYNKNYLNNKEFKEKYIASNRAFKLAMQDREISKKTDIFWSSLKQIK